MRRRRPRPRQKVMCRGARCREICGYSSRWCSNCWGMLPEKRRRPIESCIAYLAKHPADAEALQCLAAAVRDADRELEAREAA